MAEQTRRTGTDRGHSPPPTDAYVAQLSGASAEVPAVRTAIRDLAERHGFASRASDLTLALDELVANAQEHGRPPITVRCWYDGRLVLSVSDAGPGFNLREIVQSHPPVMLGRRGRGLWIIRQVTDHVHVDHDDAGTTVRVELSHEPHIGA